MRLPSSTHLPQGRIQYPAFKARLHEKLDAFAQCGNCGLLRGTLPRKVKLLAHRDHPLPALPNCIGNLKADIKIEHTFSLTMHS